MIGCQERVTSVDVSFDEFDLSTLTIIEIERWKVRGKCGTAPVDLR